MKIRHFRRSLLKNLTFWQKTGNRRHKKPIAPPQIDSRLLRPENHSGRVIFAGLGRYGYFGRGKVSPEKFFPPFVYELYRNGIESYFVSDIDSLSTLSSNGEAVVINIINEEADSNEMFPNYSIPGERILVFNSTEVSNIISDKKKTNEFLSSKNVLMPSTSIQEKNNRKIFSNRSTGTNKDTYVSSNSDDIDESRYNTVFIPTVREFAGQSYYTTVRAHCVGRELVFAYVRARAVHEGSASVHNADTPLEPELVERLQRDLVVDRQSGLAAVCAKIGEALEPGFFAHDLLISSEDERIYACETGFKFDTTTYAEHLLPISAYLPSLATIYSPEFVRLSAIAFINECRRLGYLHPLAHR